MAAGQPILHFHHRRAFKKGTLLNSSQGKTCGVLNRGTQKVLLSRGQRYSHFPNLPAAFLRTLFKTGLRSYFIYNFMIISLFLWLNITLNFFGCPYKLFLRRNLNRCIMCYLMNSYNLLKQSQLLVRLFPGNFNLI